MMVTCLCDLLDETLVVSGDEGGHIIIWDMKRRKLVFKTPKPAHSKTITSIVCLRPRESFATGGVDGLIVLWEVTTVESPVIGR